MITEYQIVGVPQVGGRVIAVRGPGQWLLTDKVRGMCCAARTAWMAGTACSAPAMQPMARAVTVLPHVKPHLACSV